MISFENDYSTGAHPRILEDAGGDEPGAGAGLWQRPLLRKCGGPHPRGLR